jgi:hypothetical protein
MFEGFEQDPAESPTDEAVQLDAADGLQAPMRITYGLSRGVSSSNLNVNAARDARPCSAAGGTSIAGSEEYGGEEVVDEKAARVKPPSYWHAKLLPGLMWRSSGNFHIVKYARLCAARIASTDPLGVPRPRMCVF